MEFCQQSGSRSREREFFFDNLLVRIHFIIVMIRWTGLAPWEFEQVRVLLEGSFAESANFIWYLLLLLYFSHA